MAFPLSSQQETLTAPVVALHNSYTSPIVGCAWQLRCGSAPSQWRVFIHNTNVSGAALLLPALSFCIEFAFDNGRQYGISLVSYIVD